MTEADYNALSFGDIVISAEGQRRVVMYVHEDREFVVAGDGVTAADDMFTPYTADVWARAALEKEDEGTR
jgi:hypothetical protein